MHWVDWLIVAIPLLIVLFIGLRTRRYVKGVADFLAAGRVAGRYVVSVASGEVGMGLGSLVAISKMYYNNGFAFQFWSRIIDSIVLFIRLSDYGIYHFRESRAIWSVCSNDCKLEPRMSIFWMTAELKVMSSWLIYN